MPTPTSLAALRLRLTHRRLLRSARSWLARSFGVSREARVAIVERMLAGHARSAPNYWLQLVLALALATLGLVLNGSAVVIGAMLVSPLMSPIIELAMGLAVGSPLLSIRSVVRTFWSIIVVIGGAALMTKALPFHEITAEIAARTSPTALDLLVAIFCALAAAFTTLRSASDTVSTAAGTAVAIALVPPLCAAGFGLGTTDWHIAQGAFLLFTANLCGILLFAAATFWLFGFNLVDTRLLEEKRFADPGPTSRSVRWVKGAFGSKYGTWLRLLIPLALVASVWLPLSRALREVSWEVQARAQIQGIVHQLPLAQAAVRSSLSIEDRTVNLRMVVVGKPGDARALQASLAGQIARATHTTPAVEVVAVPDLEAMEEVAHRLAKAESGQLRPQADLLKDTADIADVLARVWPGGPAGPLRRWRLDLTDRAHPALEVVHLGPPLGTTGVSLLASLLSDRFHAPLGVRDVAIPPEAIRADARDGAAWLPALSSALEWVRGDRGLTACVTLPPLDDLSTRRKRRRRPEPQFTAIRDAALAGLAQAPPGQARWVPGEQWAVQLKSDGCPELALAGASAGATPAVAAPPDSAAKPLNRSP